MLSEKTSRVSEAKFVPAGSPLASSKTRGIFHNSPAATTVEIFLASNRRQINYKRSDAGFLIVLEVFGFVKDFVNVAPSEQARLVGHCGKGVWGKGRIGSFPAHSTKKPGARFVRYGFPRLRIESPFISIRCALWTRR